MDYIIGIDVGTTSTKAVIYTLHGDIKGYSNQLYPLYQDTPDTAEEDPDEIFNATVTALSDVVKKVNGPVRAVSFSTQQHSLIALDENHKPLTKVITWADNRSEKQATEASNNGLGMKIYNKTGLPIHPMGPVYKIMWLKKDHPEIFEKAAYWVGLKEYIMWRFFHELKEETSMASATGLMNIFNMDWDDDILSWVGVTRKQLPELVEPTHQLTGMDKDIANKIGISPNTPFVMGATDGALAEIGLGAIDKGEVAVTIGTSGAVRTFIDKPQLDPKGRTYCYPVMNGKWIVGGPVNNGGIVFRWVRDNLFAPEKETAKMLGMDPYDFLTEIAKTIPAGSDGLLFHPFLGGERAPIWNGNARASFFGLTRSHTRAHMVRAALEGVVYNLYTVLLALQEAVGEPTVITATGGFARSALWRQMLADVFEHPVTIPEAFESGCLGAMVVGLISIGEADDLSIVKQFIGKQNTYKPDPSNFENYRDLLPVYLRVGRKLEGEYDIIADYQRKHPHPTDDK